MSALGSDMFVQSLWNSAKGLDMSGLTGDFGGKIDFDVLNFTNSPNAPPWYYKVLRTQIKYKIINSKESSWLFSFSSL
jgi:hypothetical protein